MMPNDREVLNMEIEYVKITPVIEITKNNDGFTSKTNRRNV